MERNRDTKLTTSNRWVGQRRWNSNNQYDVFIKDLSTGEISLVSQTEGGIQPDVHARLTGLTADGSAVSFTSRAVNIDVAGADGTSVFITRHQ